MTFLLLGVGHIAIGTKYLFGLLKRKKEKWKFEWDERLFRFKAPHKKIIEIKRESLCDIQASGEWLMFKVSGHSTSYRIPISTIPSELLRELN